MGKTKMNIYRAKMQTYITGPVCFDFKRARAPRHFLLDKGHPEEEIVNFCWEHFQEHRGNDQGGMEAEAMTRGAWRLRQ